MMDSHLTEAQMERLLRGAEDEAVVQHIGRCPRCADEAAMMKALFGDLRASAMKTAEMQRRQAVVLEPRATKPRAAWWVSGSALVTACLVALVLLPSQLHRRDTPVHVAAAPPVATPISDEALLNGIQSDLSQSVPAPLEPLAADAQTGVQDDGSTGTERKTQ